MDERQKIDVRVEHNISGRLCFTVMIVMSLFSLALFSAAETIAKAMKPNGPVVVVSPCPVSVPKATDKAMNDAVLELLRAAAREHRP